MPIPGSLPGRRIFVYLGRLSPLKSGNLVADGTEQTLLEFVNIGRISGYVDLGNMQVGDKVIIRQYMKLVRGGNYREFEGVPYSGVQDSPVLYIEPKETDFAIKITLQQTVGSYRSFPHNFMREL